MSAAGDAQRLFEQARERHAARDFGASTTFAREALALDPDCMDALELLSNALITRQRNYAEGLALVDRMTALNPDDAATQYTAGWLYEFAAHEIKRRRPDGVDLVPRHLYEGAADAFRRCLALNPDGKLQGDAEDLLDHVENELRQ